MTPLPCFPPPENRQRRPDFLVGISFPQRVLNPANPAVLRAEPIFISTDGLAAALENLSSRRGRPGNRQRQHQR